MVITPQQFIEICPNAKLKAEVFIPWLNKYLQEAKIDTPLRIAAFMAQAAHETGEFRYLKELGNKQYLDKYDTGSLAKALGNTPEDDDDGILYCGRGIFQVTGRSNYEMCSVAMFGDKRLLKTPQLLEEPQYAVKSACWFWTRRGLNALADRNDFLGICVKVNGRNKKTGLPNGWEDRKKYFERACKVLGVVQK